jgi:hypothetical protein
MFGKSFRYATGFSVDQPSILPVPRVAVQKQHGAARFSSCADPYVGHRIPNAVTVILMRSRVAHFPLHRQLHALFWLGCIRGMSA